VRIRNDHYKAVDRRHNNIYDSEVLPGWISHARAAIRLPGYVANANGDECSRCWSTAAMLLSSSYSEGPPGLRPSRGMCDLLQSKAAIQTSLTQHLWRSLLSQWCFELCDVQYETTSTSTRDQIHLSSSIHVSQVTMECLWSPDTYYQVCEWLLSKISCFRGGIKPVSLLGFQLPSISFDHTKHRSDSLSRLLR